MRRRTVPKSIRAALDAEAVAENLEQAAARIRDRAAAMLDADERAHVRRTLAAAARERKGVGPAPDPQAEAQRAAMENFRRRAAERSYNDDEPRRYGR